MRRKFASEIAGAEAAAGSQSKSASTKRTVPKKRTLRAESLNRVKSSYSEFHDTARLLCSFDQGGEEDDREPANARCLWKQTADPSIDSMGWIRARHRQCHCAEHGFKVDRGAIRA